MKAIKPGPVYGEPEFSRPDTAAVYDNRGGKSTVAVLCKLPVLAMGAIMPVTIYGRLNGKEARVTFDPALPKGVTIKDEARDRFRSHVNSALLKWHGRERAFTEAYQRLTAQPKPKDAKGPKNVDSIEWAPPASKDGKDGAQNGADGQ